MSFQTRVVLGFLLICLAIPLIWWRWPDAQSRRAQRMIRVVVDMPKGSTRKQVQVALQNADVEFNYQRVTDELSLDSRVARSGHTVSDLSGYVVAYVHDTPKSIIGSCSVLRYFLFDKKGALTEVLEDQGCIGL